MADPIDAPPIKFPPLFTCSGGGPFPCTPTGSHLKRQAALLSLGVFSRIQSPRGQSATKEGRELVDQCPNFLDSPWESSETQVSTIAERDPVRPSRSGDPFVTGFPPLPVSLSPLLQGCFLGSTLKN